MGAFAERFANSCENTNRVRPRLAIVGPAQSGKDTVADWFRRHTRLRYWGSSSEVIWPHAAKRLGLSLSEAWSSRHEHRELWRDIGDELRKDDPAALARHVLSRGDLCVGVRSLGEISAVSREGMVDLAIWVDRKNLPPDPTLEFGPEYADVILPNHADIIDLKVRCYNLARSLGVLRVG